MPWRLIVFILILGILLWFIGFNINNRCDVSFGPRSVESLTIENVPVCLTAIAAFLLGMLCSVPAIIGARIKKARPAKGDGSPQPPKKWGKNSKETDGNKADSSSGDTGYSEGGPYGIN